MNKILNALKEELTHIETENGGKAYSTSMNPVMDLFSLGGAYRTRSDEDCILLFKKAFDADPAYAMKCLFYLRDVRGGQGERRFFRVVCKWLAMNEPETMRRNIKYIPEYGRYDDLYCLIGTPLEKDMWDFLISEIHEGLKVIGAIKDEK